MTDDGFNLGVLYAGDREPYRHKRKPAFRTMQDLEQEFAV